MSIAKKNIQHQYAANVWVNQATELGKKFRHAMRAETVKSATT